MKNFKQSPKGFQHHRLKSNSAAQSVRQPDCEEKIKFYHCWGRKSVGDEPLGVRESTSLEGLFASVTSNMREVFMSRTKILIAMLAAALGMAANAAPMFPPNEVGATNGVGSYSVHGGRVQYQVVYDSPVGGHWILTGVESQPGYHGQTYFEDSFSGTVSDTSINGTFTESDFSWLGDVFLFCRQPTGSMVQATSFRITIRGGHVRGDAIYE